MSPESAGDWELFPQQLSELLGKGCKFLPSGVALLHLYFGSIGVECFLGVMLQAIVSMPMVLIVLQCCCRRHWLAPSRPRAKLCAKCCCGQTRGEKLGWWCTAENTCMKTAGNLVGSLPSLGFHNSCVFARLSPSICAVPLPLLFFFYQNQFFSVQMLAHSLQTLAVVNAPCLWKRPGLLGYLSRSREVTVMYLLSCHQPSASHSSFSQPGS